MSEKKNETIRNARVRRLIVAGGFVKERQWGRADSRPKTKKK